MEIRKYREEDSIAEISRVYALSWKTAYRGIVPEAYLKKIEENRWEPLLLRDCQRLLLATENYRVIGAATYCGARDERYPDWGEVISLYLLPEYYRKGIGTRLFAACQDELYKLGFGGIYLWVLEKNDAARNFYEKNGFHSSGDFTVDNIGGKPLKELRYIKTKI